MNAAIVTMMVVMRRSQVERGGIDRCFSDGIMKVKRCWFWSF